MAIGMQLMVAGLAVAVNAAALAVVHASMGQFHERQLLALQEPARVVVVGHRPVELAIQQCPAPKVL